jgi:hypothetical protein
MENEEARKNLGETGILLVTGNEVVSSFKLLPQLFTNKLTYKQGSNVSRPHLVNQPIFLPQHLIYNAAAHGTRRTD